MSHERAEDLPVYLKWAMTFINRIGFPIVVCGWLAYQQFTAGKETINALQNFEKAIIRLNDTLESQNKILRRKFRDE